MSYCDHLALFHDATIVPRVYLTCLTINISMVDIFKSAIDDWIIFDFSPFSEGYNWKNSLV